MMRKMRSRSGISYAVPAMAAFIVAATAAAIALGVLLPKFHLAAEAGGEVGAKLQRAGEVKITVIYHIGNTMLISNDGTVTVKIVKLYIGESNPRECNIVLDPGEKYALSVPQNAKNVAVQLDDGTIIPLKSGR